MRILFLSQIAPYPPHGGVLQRGYHLLQQLGSRASVELLAFVHPNLMPTSQAQNESRLALGAFCERVEYFRLWPKDSRLHAAVAIAASACTGQPFSVIAHRSSAFGRRVRELLAGGKFDILHVDTIALSQFMPRDVEVPCVLTHHNVESTLLERRARVEHSTPKRWFLSREAQKLRRYESREAPRFDLNIVVSKEDGLTLDSRMPGLQTMCVPNGVDVAYFTPADEPQEPAVVYTGGLTMFANLDAVTYFLNAIWPLISARRPEAKFYIVGRHPPPAIVAAGARDPRIVVTGYLEDIRPTVARAAVYVVPLRVGGGTRLKVLDAMAMGKAIVATSVGCEGIELQPGEHIEIADTPEHFAETTLALLGDPDRRRTLGRAARRQVEERYAWQRVATTLFAAYDRAIATQEAVA